MSNHGGFFVIDENLIKHYYYPKESAISLKMNRQLARKDNMTRAGALFLIGITLWGADIMAAKPKAHFYFGCGPMQYLGSDNHMLYGFHGQAGREMELHSLISLDTWLEFHHSARVAANLVLLEMGFRIYVQCSGANVRPYLMTGAGVGEFIGGGHDTDVGCPSFMVGLGTDIRLHRQLSAFILIRYLYVSSNVWRDFRNVYPLTVGLKF